MASTLVPDLQQEKLPFYSQEVGSQIIQGDALAGLRELPGSSFRCCVTSPPYWGLRDYQIDHQIGAEDNLEDYLGKLREVFCEVGRVLTKDGTLWLNIGDGYTSGNRTWRDKDRKNPARAMAYRPPTPDGLNRKISLESRGGWRFFCNKMGGS